MSTYSRRHSLGLVAALAGLMALTRGSHFGSAALLPDASWAVFFLLGFYFRERALLPLFLALAAGVDFVAVGQGGVSNYCLTPAYGFLIPAYFALWLAGRGFARHHRLELHTLPRFAVTALAATFVCEVISSGSFYFLGGRFTDTSMQVFGERLVQYFPLDLVGCALYLGAAAALHLLANNIRQPRVAGQ